MEHTFLVAGFVVALALSFGLSNGFHDSASQVATVISSRALSPEIALTLAAVADFAGAYFLGTSVARTIGKGIVDPQIMRTSEIGVSVLVCALFGAISWNLITWYFGIPSSSSHALIGGLIGGFVAGWGTEPIQWKNVQNIFLVMLVSPLAGFVLTYVFTKMTFFATQWFSPKANETFKSLQILSLIGQSLAHGTNDAQKVMGVIAFALIILNLHNSPAGTEDLIPRWVILSCSLSMAIGIALGGWKIIRTLGAGLYRVRPIHGFASQSTSALIMYLTSLFGFPVSTTQVISSSIMGAGAAFRPKSVRWAVAGDMVMAWLVTIPASGLIAASAFKLMQVLSF
jgi:PiT family inorganic phosphate transporter